MKKHRKIFYVFISVLMLWAVSISSAYALNDTVSNLSLQTNFDNVVKENGFLQNEDSKSIANVDGWVISQDDLNYRLKEHKAAGNNDTANDVMNILLEEAALFSQAEKLGVLPTNQDVEHYLKDLFSDPELKSIVENDSTMTPEVIKFYAFKTLAYNNVYHYYLDEGRNQGLITPEWTYDKNELAKYQYGNGDDYYYEKRLQHKKNVQCTSSVNFQPTMNKLVLLKENYNSDSADNILYSNKIVQDNQSNSIAKAAYTSNVKASGTGRCSGEAQNWGPFSIPYNVAYYGDQFDKNGLQYMGYQDLLVTSSMVGNMNPELRSRVTPAPVIYSQGYTSSGSAKTKFSAFNRPLFGNYITNYKVFAHGSYGGSLGNSGSYYMKAYAGIFVEDYLFQSGNNITVKTSNF